MMDPIMILAGGFAAAALVACVVIVLAPLR